MKGKKRRKGGVRIGKVDWGRKGGSWEAKWKGTKKERI